MYTSLYIQLHILQYYKTIGGHVVGPGEHGMFNLLFCPWQTYKENILTSVRKT